MATNLYRVILLRERDPEAAEIIQSPFASHCHADARNFTDAFNDRELVDPAGIWAVVRVESESPRRSRSKRPTC